MVLFLSDFTALNDLFFVSQVTNLVEQLEQFREELENKNEEVQQLHMQLEIQRKESATRLQELEQENKVLKVSSTRSPNIQAFKV